PEGALRETGEYVVAVQVHPEVMIDVTLAIVPE
ncbi:MAG TPA: 50S ribosomal protein L9, partial [Halieaceae bacterium]|nr:50S ribosomal protein L9 [Halieaceae bacterium]